LQLVICATEQYADMGRFYSKGHQAAYELTVSINIKRYWFFKYQAGACSEKNHAIYGVCNYWITCTDSRSHQGCIQYWGIWAKSVWGSRECVAGAKLKWYNIITARRMLARSWWSRRPSVTRMLCDETKKNILPVFGYHTLTFWHQRRLVGNITFHLKFALKVPPLWKTPTSTNICL